MCSDFALVESEIPKPGAGEVLVRSQWLSLGLTAVVARSALGKLLAS